MPQLHKLPRLASHYEPAPIVPSQPSAIRNATSGAALQTLLVVIAAIALVALGAWSLVHFGVRPVIPTGVVEQIWADPIHHESTVGGGPNNAAPVKQPFDQTIVLVKVKIQNPSKIPIFVRDMTATVTLPSETHDSSAAGAGDFRRIFIAYPELAQHQADPLPRDTTIPPGASAEGLMAFNFPLTKQQWDTHTALTLTISFVHQADITLNAPDLK